MNDVEFDSDGADDIEILDVYEQAEDGDAEDQFIVRVEIDAQGFLAIADVRPGHHDFLQRTVAQLNAKAAITLVSDEPTEMPLATGLLTVTREAPDFVSGVRRYLQTYYGLRLG